jgi:multicomponent Na+:H+ antiporter subunit C
MDLLKALAIGALFGIGVFQLLRRNLLRSAIGVMALSNAVNLFLLMTGAYQGLVPAYVTETGQRSDALPQALILTSIVISMAAFSIILGLVYVITVRYRTSDADEVAGMKG